MNVDSPLTQLKGIGEKTAQIFQRTGIYKVGDLLEYYPRNYETLTEVLRINEVTEGMAAISGMIAAPLTVKRFKGMQITSGLIRDGSGEARVSWFRMPYLKNTLKAGSKYVFRGKATRKGEQLFLEQPAVYEPENYSKKQKEMQPLYPLVAGLTNGMLQKAIHQVLDEKLQFHDFLPEGLRLELNLVQYQYAIEQIHFPKDYHRMMLARKRLVFDEFFLFVLALRRLREGREEVYRREVLQKSDRTEDIIVRLDFELTKAQRKVWQEIEGNLTGKKVMARLVQGDVGSGKTILAVLALFMTVENNCQGSLMVPTEVLAVQHFASITALLESQKLPYKAILLTGSMTAKEKRIAYEKIKLGEADIIIGTHALIQEKVEYKKLALVVTDEQHRFGVRQREALAQKGELPHVLVMSATPIPRTLAVILYGDLDVSILDELPANRLPIKNCVVDIRYRPKAYAFIEQEVLLGRQAYVICPMVEESEMVEAENVIAYTGQLKEVLDKSITVEYLHGKMKAKEKNLIMEKFLKKEIQVLVSTTVIEVGVNVPNATVMMIENAERFGLAQLHQLRGRVGRGAHQSYCILVRGSDSKKVKERLEILNHSNDGFHIASEDLKLRGPGDVFGIRQSGMLEFALGDVYTDADMLKAASEAAEHILEKDSCLILSEHEGLCKKLDYYMREELESVSI